MAVYNNQRLVGNVSSLIIGNYCSFINSIASVNPFINKKEFCLSILNDIRDVEMDRSEHSPHKMLLLASMSPVVAPSMVQQIEPLRARPKDDREPNGCLENAVKEWRETGNEMEWGLWLTNPSSKSVSAVWHAVNRDAEGNFYDTQPHDGTYNGCVGLFIPSGYTHNGIRQIMRNTRSNKGTRVQDIRYDLYMFEENGRFHIIREVGCHFDAQAGRLAHAGDGKREYLGWMTWDGDMPMPHLHDVPLVVG
jgi:hypothetical protein